MGRMYIPLGLWYSQHVRGPSFDPTDYNIHPWGHTSVNPVVLNWNEDNHKFILIIFLHRDYKPNLGLQVFWKFQKAHIGFGLEAQSPLEEEVLETGL